MATTTPNYGWTVPTSTDLVKDGATAIETLGDAIDASLVDLRGGTTGQVLRKQSNTQMDFEWAAPSSGLTLINTTSFSAVASQSVNNVFTSAYKRYRILIDAVGSVNNDITFRLRVAGTDATANNYGTQSQNGDGSTANAIRTTAATFWYTNDVRSAGRYMQEYELFNPQAASQTFGLARASSIVTADTTAFFQTVMALGHSLSTAYDGFTLTASTGTVTGSVQVYGYNQ
jgi:hypothetical protein